MDWQSTVWPSLMALGLGWMLFPRVSVIADVGAGMSGRAVRILAEIGMPGVQSLTETGLMILLFGAALGYIMGKLL